MVLLASFIAGLLIIVSLVIFYLRRKRDSSELYNNTLRIRTWWIIFGVCIPIFMVGDWILLTFIYVLIIWASFEFLRLLNITLTTKDLLAFSFVLVSYTALIVSFPEFLAAYFLIPFLLLIITLIISIRLSSLDKLEAFLSFAFCASSLLSINLIWHYTQSLNYDAGLIILFLFFITASNDIFQYSSGKVFGRTPLTPKLSKKKTVEGAVGGILLTGLVCAFALPQIINISTLTALMIGLIIAILGIIGDLTISYYKRQANVKDSGSSLPGHGGLLDRIDSMMLTAPGFGLCLEYLA